MLRIPMRRHRRWTAPPARQRAASPAAPALLLIATLNVETATTRSSRDSATRLGEVVSRLWRYRALIAQMTRRDVTGRYRGSMLGLLWSLFHPVLMLATYTFVFSVIFKARWGEDVGESKVDFAIILFTGLIVFSLFSECINRAPGLVLNNVNYVKKVVFPLEILPWVTFCSALFHFGVSLAVLLAFLLASGGALHWTILLLPIVMLPLMLLTLGLSWLLASLGVYIRDVGQSVGVITMVLMFMSPIFYPVSAVPEDVRGWIRWSPLTQAIEQAREVVIYGRLPDWSGLLTWTIIGTLTAWLGLAWFQRTRGGFADVL
jgi:lipopolysaccharide transport system permease protein